MNNPSNAAPTPALDVRSKQHYPWHGKTAVVTGASSGIGAATERIGVTAERIASGVLGLLKKPRRVIYIPRILTLTPIVETYFGWLIDRLGPLLLRKETSRIQH